MFRHWRRRGQNLVIGVAAPEDLKEVLVQPDISFTGRLLAVVFWHVGSKAAEGEGILIKVADMNMLLDLLVQDLDAGNMPDIAALLAPFCPAMTFTAGLEQERAEGETTRH